MIGDAAGTTNAVSNDDDARRVIVDLGPVDAVPIGQGRAYIIGKRTVAVFRQRDGHLFAIDNECPHRGGPLAEGIVGDGKVICPLHGWKINLLTGHCVGERGDVRTYTVQEVSNRILVLLPE